MLNFETNHPRKKYFNHKLLPEIKLERISENGKRFYVTETGEKYPSVTTVLSSLSKAGIQQWEDRVGKDEAQKIRQQAATRGTKMHSICESYVRNEDGFLLEHMPTNIDLFKQIQPYLDEHVDNIYGIELFLYSDKLKTAGATDLFCRMHGTNTIADFKSASKPKSEQWIEGYFLQSTAYAMMIEERYNITVPEICILIAVEHEGLQHFNKKTNFYRDKVIEIFNQYHVNNS
jgi:genome maintenance exonuclease 1